MDECQDVVDLLYDLLSDKSTTSLGFNRLGQYQSIIDVKSQHNHQSL